MAAAVKHASFRDSVSKPAPAGGRTSHTPGRSRKTPPQPADRKPSASDLKVPTADQLRRRRSTIRPGGVPAGSLSQRRMTKGSMDKDHVAAAAAAAAAALAAKPKVRLENTYRTTPQDDQHFSARRAQELIREVLESQLHGEEYRATQAPALAARLSERVKEAVKGVQSARYKLVCNVLLGPVHEHGMVVASRCLWDPATDNSSTITFNNGKVLAIANVFAVYFE